MLYLQYWTEIRRWGLLYALVGPSGNPIFGSFGGRVTRAVDFEITSGLENTGNAITNGVNLQAALNTAALANDGRTLTLDASATYAGNFTLPSGLTQTTTVRSSKNLPLRRITNADGEYLAKLQTGNGNPVIVNAAGAAYWTLQGLNITNDHSVFVNRLIVLTPVSVTYTEADMSERPRRIVLDRCWVHEYQKDNVGYTMGLGGSVAACLELAALDCTITRSRIAGASYVNEFSLEGGQAAYAVFLPAGTERLTIDDSYLEGYFSSIFMGGSTSIPKAVASATMSGLLVNAEWTSFTMASPDHATLIGYQLRFDPTGAGATIDMTTVIPITVTSYSSPNVTIAEGLWPLTTGDPATPLVLGTEYDVYCRTVAAGPTYGSWTLVKSAWTFAAHVYTATFSNVGTGEYALAVNRLIALKVSGGRCAPTNSSHSYETIDYQVAKVTNVTGSSVSFTPMGALQKLTAGNPLLQAPNISGPVVWGGYMNEDISITRTQFHLDLPSHLAGWNSGNPPDNPGPVGKGFMETKNCRRLTLSGCKFTGWTAAVFFSGRNQASSGSGLRGSNVWSTTRDVTATHLWCAFEPTMWDRAYSSALAGPQPEDDELTSERGSNFTLRNWLIDGSVSIMLSALQGCDNCTIDHWTWPGGVNPHEWPPTQVGSRIANVLGTYSDGLVIKNSIFAHGEYGIVDSSGVSPTGLPNKSLTHNVVIDNRQAATKIANGSLTGAWPNNYIEDSESAIANIDWTDPAQGNYRLLGTSPYKNAGLDSTDIGVDQNALEAALGEEIS